MWQWLQGLSGGAATFVGAVSGSLIGLLALLFGALFNAHLNRRRDDRLRKEEARAIATALRAELAGLRRILTRNAEELRNPKSDFIVPELRPTAPVFRELLPKIGYLDADTVGSVIDAYTIVDQYTGHLILRGGKKGPEQHGQQKLIAMAQEKAPIVISLNKLTADELEKTMDKLDNYLR
jgi:hypothetical protein